MEPLLEFLDTFLKDGDVALELFEPTFHEVAAASLVQEGRFDPAQPFDNHEVFLLETLETAVNSVEVADYLAESRFLASLQRVEAATHPGKCARHRFELSVVRDQMRIDGVEPAVQELDERLIFSLGHRLPPHALIAASLVYRTRPLSASVSNP